MATSIIRVALFGPSGSGKTVFRKVLLGQQVRDTRPNRRAVRRNIQRTYRMETKVIGDVGTIRYTLGLIDVPGRMDLRDIRLNVLNRVCGYIFFYDSTDPKSPELLLEMIRSELKEKKKFKSMLASIVVGSKKDIHYSSDIIMGVCDRKQ